MGVLLNFKPLENITVAKTVFPEPKTRGSPDQYSGFPESLRALRQTRLIWRLR
jgi:hypothetical protein